MDDILNLRNQDFSILGKDSVLKGEFHLSGIIKTSSRIEGNLFLGTQGKLTIEPNGSVKGRIQGEHVEIYGEFEGTIESAGKVIIHSSSKVSGEIRAQTLTVFPGAVVNIVGNTVEQ